MMQSTYFKLDIRKKGFVPQLLHGVLIKYEKIKIIECCKAKTKVIDPSPKWRPKI